ncbi:MAG: hypothetical protein MRY57_04230 [Candidatus Pacebacteria bacterium]|nr:hypothetical protein [Candidatus Paceibacterota bacterium]
MLLNVESYIKQLHEHKESFIEIVATGASASLQGILTSIPGCSNTLLGGTFPYSQEASTLYVGGMLITKFVSQEMANALAAEAWYRGRKHGFNREKVHPNMVVGLSVTGSIDPGRPKRGYLGAYMCLKSRNYRREFSIEFPKKTDNTSLFGRTLENDLCDFFALKLVLDHYSVAKIDIHNFRSTDRPDGLSTEEMNLLKQFYRIEGRMFHDIDRIKDVNIFLPEHDVISSDLDDESFNPNEYFLLPSSANPLHIGHEEMARIVAIMTGKKPLFLLETSHPIKGDLSNREINKRLMQFNSLYAVAVTYGAGTYAKMGELFPNTPIVIGVDNMVKISDPRYLKVSGNGTLESDSDSDLSLLEQAMMPYHNHGTSFLVFERPGSGLTFGSVMDTIPWGFGDLFQLVPSRLPEISSTYLRDTQ